MRGGEGTGLVTQRLAQSWHMTIAKSVIKGPGNRDVIDIYLTVTWAVSGALDPAAVFSLGISSRKGLRSSALHQADHTDWCHQGRRLGSVGELPRDRTLRGRV